MANFYDYSQLRTGDFVYALQSSRLNSDLQKYPNIKSQVYKVLEIELRKLEESYPFQKDGTPSEIRLSTHQFFDSIEKENEKENLALDTLVNFLMLEVIPRLLKKGYNASFENSNELVVSVNMQFPKTVPATSGLDLPIMMRRNYI